jgi:hypothetical protein
MEVDDRGRAVFSHGELGSLLDDFVSDGGVRYEAWSRDQAARRRLDAYLDRVARVSPDSAPNLFPTRGDRVVYWICAHNAFAIRSILDHWPVGSVREIRGGWEPVKGYSYYRKSRFEAGGRKVSLADIVRKRLPAEANRDARVMLLVNCGSRSCAPLRPEVASAWSLEGLLATATATFLGDEANLAIDHARKRLRLSGVFQRARRMIARDPRSGRGRGRQALRTWLFTLAPPARSPDLALARDYAVEFMPWDWRVNAR